MRRRFFQSVLALASLILFLGLGWWMLNSDQRFDQLHLSKLLIRGSNAKIVIIYGNHTAAYAPFYMSMPCELPAGSEDRAQLGWNSFTYFTTESAAHGVVVPAWLPLLLLIIMPCVWIYGIPSRPKRRAEAAETSPAPVSPRGFAG